MSPIPSLPNAVAVDMSGLVFTISSLRVALPDTEEMGPWQEARFTAILILSALLIFPFLSATRLRPTSLSLLIATATIAAQYLLQQPLPALQFYLVATEALFLTIFTPFTTDDIDSSKDYKSYGSNLASVALWGLMVTNQSHLGRVWPAVFGFFFCFMWPLSFVVGIGLPVSGKPLSETAILAAAVISIAMAHIFQFGMDISFWATWPITVLSLYWAFPKDAPIAWNIIGLALLAIMGLAIDITYSPMTFQVFSLGVSAMILAREVFLDAFCYREPHNEKDCLDTKC